MSKNTQLGNLVNGIYVDSTGKVGVGTSSPLTNITVGDSATQQQPYLSLARTATGGYFAGIRFYDGTNIKSYIQEDADFNLRFGTSNTERMRITSAGNVGIGTSSPNKLLELAANSPVLRLTTTTQNTPSSIELGVLNGGNYGYAKIGVTNVQDYDTNLTFWTTPATSTTQVERMRITKDGNVGIGTSSPQRQFVVSNGGAEGMEVSAGSGRVTIISYNRSTSSWLPLILTEGSSNVLIGTTSDNGYKLNVSGSIYASSSIVSQGGMYAGGGIGFQGNLVGDYGYSIGMNSNSQVSGNAWYMQISSSWSHNFRFFYGGTGVGSGSAKFQIDTGGGYTGISDINKKKDIALSTLGLAEIIQLKPSTFKFKDDVNEEEQIGFIAQEVKDVIPYAYYEDKEGDDKFIGLKQAAFIPVLVKAIQELKAEIDILKNK